MTLKQGEKKMNKEPCLRCHGDMIPGKTTNTYEYNESLLVLRDIPALVCDQCGEAMFHNDVIKVLERITDEFKKSHRAIEITRYDDVA